MRLLFTLILCLTVGSSLYSQSNARIKELEEKRSTLQKQIAESEKLLQTTSRDVKSQLGTLETLTGQIEERRRYIRTLTSDMESIGKELILIRRQITTLEKELSDKKKKYETSVQYLHRNKTVEEKLMFILSAQTLAQSYRRLRYVREYATYQRLQGEDILKKQQQVITKKQELEQARHSKEELIQERFTEQAILERQEKEKRTLLTDLQKKQKGLQQEIRQRRSQAEQLNGEIDRLVAEEIEKARQRAREEALWEKKATAEPANPEINTPVPAKPEPIRNVTLTKADRELSGTFAGNRGRLPAPITGAYIIVSKYGQYTAPGLKNVKLDNKGIDIQGQAGANARAIFDGEVTAVFQLNGLVNVLVRHGNYISVYCNLASTTVKQGDKVKTRQEIGPVFANPADGNRTILHFQLRRETEKLNPELWIER
ncbi:MAG: peptidoglycan DD-metalloendopeptidase family protein [Bacteroides sp.]|nr:peptidoglycan DD-metalloendopeptidase family protein [Bacteroides sp.]